jgi:hypothetical protein
MRELGDPIHQVGDRLPKIPAEVIQGDGSVLDRVVEQSGGNHIDRHAQVDQDGGHGKAVVYVGFTGSPFYAFMGFFGGQVGSMDDLPFKRAEIVGKDGQQLLII